MREPGCRERAVIPTRARSGMAALARTPVIPEATPVGALSADSVEKLGN